MTWKASQCTHMQRPQRCILASPALGPTILSVDRTPEWLWRKPCSPSCSHRVRRSSLPKLQVLLHCWAAAAEPCGSTGRCEGHKTPHAGCQSAPWYPRGRRCPRWRRSGGVGRPWSASPEPKTWLGVQPTRHHHVTDRSSGSLGGTVQSDSHDHLRCRRHHGGLSRRGRM